MSIVVENNEQLAKKWSAWASGWDKYIAPFFLPTSATLIASLLLNTTPNANILEIGCGSGAAAALCNTLKQPTSRLSAIDVTPEMVTLAKKKVNDTSVNIQVASADALPFPDSHFDRLYSSFTLHLVPDADDMLREVLRVLKDGSIAAFSIWGRKENCNMVTITDSVLKEMNINIPVSTTGAPRSNWHLGLAEDVKKRILDAGFTSAQVFYQPQPIMVANGEDYLRCLAARPGWQGFALRSMSNQNMRDLEAAVTRKVDDLLASGGLINLESIIIIARKGIVKI